TRCSVMTDQRWGGLAKKIEPDWGPEREHRARFRIAHREARRRTTVRVGASLLTLVLVAGGVRAFVGLRTKGPAPADTTLSAEAVPPAALAPAVTVTHLSPETVLEAMPDHHGRGFVLRSGGARFNAPHDPKRSFIVVAGDVVIEDLGTTFTVQYLSTDRLDIAVEQGRVKVHARGADREIAAGDRLEVSVSQPAAEKPSRPPAAPATSSWRPLAEKGRYDEAHLALKKAGPNAVRDETADLLLAADAARLSGYPAESVPYLERVVRAHSRDPRSSLASFTLGRVLLDELGRPREAADAFARARAVGGPLAEDALAREVEAASRAGDITRSRELAREYQTRYPNGRRAKAVSRFGGID
ncbi:MAG TPA: FecR domain-containing protein, partial [Polyangia bacterium]|nr:FecR domain-containing protein [Polyangia bacterium]